MLTARRIACGRRTTGNSKLYRTSVVPERAPPPNTGALPFGHQDAAKSSFTAAGVLEKAAVEDRLRIAGNIKRARSAAPVVPKLAISEHGRTTQHGDNGAFAGESLFGIPVALELAPNEVHVRFIRDLHLHLRTQPLWTCDAKLVDGFHSNLTPPLAQSKRIDPRY